MQFIPPPTIAKKEITASDYTFKIKVKNTMTTIAPITKSTRGSIMNFGMTVFLKLHIEILLCAYQWNDVSKKL